MCLALWSWSRAKKMGAEQSQHPLILAWCILRAGFMGSWLTWKCISHNIYPFFLFCRVDLGLAEPTEQNEDRKEVSKQPFKLWVMFEFIIY